MFLLLILYPFSLIVLRPFRGSFETNKLCWTSPVNLPGYYKIFMNHQTILIII